MQQLHTSDLFKMFNNDIDKVIGLRHVHNTIMQKCLKIDRPNSNKIKVILCILLYPLIFFTPIYKYKFICTNKVS